MLDDRGTGAEVTATEASAEHASMAGTVVWPRKLRELHNHHFDSTVWNDFRFRSDDIIVATYGKSGTTWVQQIAGQLIFGGSANVSMAELSLWLDLRAPPKEVKLAQL